MANTKKSKKVLKVVTGVTSLALVGAISFGLTYAFLTATTNEKDNVFTAGNVDIDVVEPKYDLAASHTYAPGQNMDKDPSIDLVGTSNDAYVSMRVRFKVATTQNADGTWNYKDISYTDFQKYASFVYVEEGADDNIFNPKWSMRDVDDGKTTTNGLVFYYRGANDGKNRFAKVEKAEGSTVETPAIFTNVVFKNEQEFKDQSLMVKDQAGKDVYPDIKIIVDGYAIQADNLTDTSLTSDAEGSVRLLLKELMGLSGV